MCDLCILPDHRRATHIMVGFGLLALFLQSRDMSGMHDMPYTPNQFSLFNHHLAGVLIIFLAVFTFLEESADGKAHSWVK